MSKPDYYEVLGIDRDASEPEIKKAYRQKAAKLHPDRNPGNKAVEEQFKMVNEAYEVLNDRQKRATYDQWGHAGAQGAGVDMGATFRDVFGNIFGDIFEGRQGPQSGADLRYHLEISLEDAVFGKTVAIEVPTLVACPDCSGSGARKGSSPVRCTDCAGQGQVRLQQGFFTVQQTCPICRGRGKTISDPCSPCRGQGRKKQTKQLSVKIPSGIDTGDRIRLTGEGEAGELGAPAGDLYVQMSVKKHAIFERDNQDLYCEMPISFTMAALGSELDVPTLKGNMKLKIPPETQTGKLFRLKGKGIPSVRGGGVGDLVCRVVIETPIHLSAEQKVLLEKFEQTLSKSSKQSPKSTSWVDMVKKFIGGGV